MLVVVALLASSSLADSLRPGYGVVASATVPAHTCTPMPLVVQLRLLWPDRFTTDTSAKRALRRSLVLMDGKQADTTTIATDGAEVSLLARVVAGPPPGQGRRGKAPDERLDVAYEDDHCAVVCKPPGINVAQLRTLLATSLAPSPCSELEPLWRPQHVHRLDKCVASPQHPLSTHVEVAR